MHDHPSSEESPQATVPPQPAPGVSHQTRSTPSTQSGSIGVYDRPASVPRSRSPVNVALLIVALFIAIVAAYFFVL